MDITTTVIIGMVVVLIAGFVSGLSGFGFALVGAPPLLLLYDPAAVVLFTKLLPLMTAVIILVNTWDKIDRRTVFGLLPAAILGAIAGLPLLTRVPAPLIALVAGVVVTGFALAVMRGWTPPGVTSAAATGTAGFTSGLLLTLTGQSGPPVILLLTGRGFAPQPFRATAAGYFFLTNIIGLLVLVLGRAVDRADAMDALMLLPAAALGAIAGQFMSKRVPPARFRDMVFILLLATGMIAILTSIWAMLR